MQHNVKTASTDQPNSSLAKQKTFKAFRKFISFFFFIWSWKYSACVEMSEKQRKKMSQVSVSIISSGKYLTQPRQVHGNIYMS
jgi:hypothetical protein